ncbi:hypothetical protein AX15_004883 [Amanita polypyramis BW_CC]|nr:hypothetical protein AX15_004883 [Amanita polypyramis BW_CC]
MAVATLQLGVPLHNTMGAMFIGVLVSAVLHGITLVQAYYYFFSYPRDAWYLKSLVMALVLLDAIHLSFVSHMMYHYLISKYYDHTALQRITWSIVMEGLCTWINSALVQAFYALRAWKLSNGNWFLFGIIMVLVIAQAACGFAWVGLAIQVKTYEELLRISPLTITTNAISTFVDIFIAVTLVTLLYRSRTAFRKSDTIINRLIVFTVNTGMLTSVCSACVLVSLLASPHTLIYAAFYYCVGRLYTNSFIATLNARMTAAQIRDGSGGPAVTFQSVSASDKGLSQQGNFSAKINTTQEVDVDGPAKTVSIHHTHFEGNDRSDDETTTISKEPNQ